MNYQDLFDELRALQKFKNNWYSVSKVVSRVKEAAAGSANPAKRLREASEACGYSQNTLNRMIVVKDFLDAVKESVPKLGDVDANYLPFTTLEVVKRLHYVDPEQGVQMLLEVVKGRMTIRKLREKYGSTVAEKADVASAHQVARIQVKDFEDAAVTAVQTAASKLFEEPLDLSRKPPRFPPISFAGYRSRPNSYTPVVGFDFFMTRIADQSVNLDRLLQRTLSYAGFFSRYWIIFDSRVGEQRIKDFCTIMKKLNRLSVGVAALPWGEDKVGLSGGAEDLKVHLDPTGDPTPDWRQKIFDVQELRSSMNRPR